MSDPKFFRAPPNWGIEPKFPVFWKRFLGQKGEKKKNRQGPKKLFFAQGGEKPPFPPNPLPGLYQTFKPKALLFFSLRVFSMEKNNLFFKIIGKQSKNFSILLNLFSFLFPPKKFLIFRPPLPPFFSKKGAPQGGGFYIFFFP